MNIQSLIPILAVIAGVIAFGVIIWFIGLGFRSRRLKEKYGPEYDYTLEKLGDRRTAEADLAEREDRVNRLDLHDLNDHEKDRYYTEWTEIQANFVDDPGKSVEQANRLITEIMIARGFPVADFEQRCEDLSVLYPNLVPNYRQAYALASKNQNGSLSTEELRQAMIDYHLLFDHLLGTIHNTDTVEERNKEMERA